MVLTITDIQGLEDRFGDMDFKVAGTRQGITQLFRWILRLRVLHSLEELWLKQGSSFEILDVIESAIEPR